MFIKTKDSILKIDNSCKAIYTKPIDSTKVKVYTAYDSILKDEMLICKCTKNEADIILQKAIELWDTNNTLNITQIIGN